MFVYLIKILTFICIVFVFQNNIYYYHKIFIYQNYNNAHRLKINQNVEGHKFVLNYVRETKLKTLCWK